MRNFFNRILKIAGGIRIDAGADDDRIFAPFDLLPNLGDGVRPGGGVGGGNANDVFEFAGNE